MHQNLLDPFIQGLVTPPNTADLQSPFDTADYGGYGEHGFDLPSESLSFASSNTMDSETTLVYHDTAASIDHFLSNVHVGLEDYDHGAANWALPATESFDADPTWVTYNGPSSTPALGWDGNDGKGHAWNDMPISIGEMGGVSVKMWEGDEGKAVLHEWTTVVPSSPIKIAENEEWSEWGNERSPVKMGSHVENIEQKLGVWIEENGDGEEKGGYEEGNDAKYGYEVFGNSNNEYPEVEGLDHGIGSGLGDGGDQEKGHMHEWEVVDDDFDYRSLADRLKA